MAYDYSTYLRGDKFPHIWCPGCTYGIVMKAIIRAIDTAGFTKNDTAIVSGIGCASRLRGTWISTRFIPPTGGHSGSRRGLKWLGRRKM